MKETKIGIIKERFIIIVEDLDTSVSAIDRIARQKRSKDIELNEPLKTTLT